MNEIKTVFRFTFLDGLRKKIFLVMTVIFMVLIVGISVVLRIVSDSSANDNSAAAATAVAKTSTCYVIDNVQIPGLMDMLNTAHQDVDFIPGTASDLDSYRSQIKNDSSISAIMIDAPPAAGGLPAVTAYVMDFMHTGATNYAADVKAAYVNSAFQSAGIPDEYNAMSQANITPVTQFVGSTNLSGYILGILLTLIMFFAIYFYGYFVALSVASEKTSRVMETLVVSAKPSRILIGKCLAMGLLGLIQLTIFILTAVICWNTVIPAGYTVSGMSLSLVGISWYTGVLVLVYFILGYFLFAMISSVCGATVSRAEDLQVAMMPSALLAVVSFYLSYIGIAVSGGGGSFNKVLTYIPFTAPFVMPSRLLSGQVSALDVILSLLILAAGLALVSSFAMRLYTASVLHYGERIKLKNLLKMRA